MNAKMAVVARKKDTFIRFLSEKKLNPKNDVAAADVVAITKFYLSHSYMLFQAMASFAKQYLMITLL